MLANPPFVPSLSVTVSTVTVFPVPTSFVSKLEATDVFKVSLPISPDKDRVPVAVVAPSYTLFAALTVALNAFAVIE